MIVQSVLKAILILLTLLILVEPYNFFTSAIYRNVFFFVTRHVIHSINACKYRTRMVSPVKGRSISNLNRDIYPVFFYRYSYMTLPSYASYSIRMIKQYCSKHGYEFIDLNHGTINISPYWLRVKDLISLSRQYDENAVFVYMDLDTCINPMFMNTTFNEILNSLDDTSTWDIYVGKSMNPNRYINSGVMFVRNTTWSRQLLNSWWNTYNPSKWIKQTDKWYCIDQDKLCAWAGDNYEQGELEKLYMSNFMNAKDHIAIIHMDFIYNAFKKSQNTFMYHLMGTDNKLVIESFFSELADDHDRLIRFTAAASR